MNHINQSPAAPGVVPQAARQIAVPDAKPVWHGTVRRRFPSFDSRRRSGVQEALSRAVEQFENASDSIVPGSRLHIKRLQKSLLQV
jgi:hypothetical protein